MSARRDRLLASIAPILLAAIALIQLAIANVHELTPWKGGGFGMFSTVDSPELRFLRVRLITSSGAVPARIPQIASRIAQQMRSSPSRSRLERLASMLAAGRWIATPGPRGLEFKMLAPNEPTILLPASFSAVRVEFWRGGFESRRGLLYGTRVDVVTAPRIQPIVGAPR